jgi:hypothetical protein
MWGLVMLLTTFFAVNAGYGIDWLNMMGSMYPGYTISKTGCLVGLFYGFVDGFIFMYLFGWIYNKLKI